MSKDQLLSKMRNLLLSRLGDKCLSHSLDFDRGRATFDLINGTKIYVRYNNHGQYSYVIQFSSMKLDRIRFDNYDETWQVATRPHHLHTRNSETVIETETRGIPKNDVNIIINTLKAETKLF